MKKILILLVTAVFLSSCFWEDVEDELWDIVSNIVDVQETSSWSDSEDSVDDIESEEDGEEVSEESDDAEVSEPIVSGSDNDPRVNNTQGEWTNPPETQTPSVPTEANSNQEEDILKSFEEDIDSLFDDSLFDLLESDEG